MIGVCSHLTASGAGAVPWVERRAGPTDGGTCSCPKSENPCVEFVCAGAACLVRARADGEACGQGRCLAGECCLGCVADGKCVPGTEIAACGAGGAACSRCNTASGCARDKCTAGVCGQDLVTGGLCPDGVCSAGKCQCGGPGEPCCATGVQCRDQIACKGGTCGDCDSD